MKLRLAEIQKERAITPQPPVVRGGALIVPIGLLRKRLGQPAPQPAPDADRAEVERLAMQAVMAAEEALGRDPRDVSAQRGIGYDIESRQRTTGELFFVEVKGRADGAGDVTLTRTEVLCALNEPEKFRLAVVVVEPGGKVHPPVYVRRFDFGQPGFAQTSSSYSRSALLADGGEPS